MFANTKMNTDALIKKHCQMQNIHNKAEVNTLVTLLNFWEKKKKIENQIQYLTSQK